MNQNYAWSLMVGGVAAFLFTAVGHQVGELQSWSQAVEPKIVGKFLVEVGSALTAIYGAYRVRQA